MLSYTSKIYKPFGSEEYERLFLDTFLPSIGVTKKEFEHIPEIYPYTLTEKFKECTVCHHRFQCVLDYSTRIVGVFYE